LGPGGLSRERAGFDVRDVHFSHYGRICPIETPEGPNIGLLSSLASYARINSYGFIESPYRWVLKSLPYDSPDLVGRTVTENVVDEEGKTIVGKGRIITKKKIAAVRLLPEGTVIQVSPFVTGAEGDVVYLSADQEEVYRVAQANSLMDNLNQFVQERVEVRVGETYTEAPPDAVDLIDVSPMQIMSISAALIPFLEHDDANRALMGSNMQRQAVPLLRPQAPMVGTGIESRVARDSGQMALSEDSGLVTSVTGREIVVTDTEGNERHHQLIKFARTNQGTCFDQRPIVAKGDVVEPGDVLADSSSTDHGELALGQNVLVAFMSWEGYNYEDAIIVSERLVKDDYFTSTHIEKH
jgi:DNA-directed RNA polymerase subunit beta